MSNLITKSDFLRYLECPAYFWFFKKKPEVLENMELNDFQKELVKNGQEVELWARKLFPKGILVEEREEAAIKKTQELLDKGHKHIFQATFQAENLYAMVDILEWDEKNKYWIINEVKGTSSKDKKDLTHLYDAAFQYILLKKAGYKVGQVNLIELDKKFCKQGEINARKLLKTTDITDKAEELEEDINAMIVDMKRLLETDREPQPCECIYKSRGNHCPAFKYLHPDVPDYSVHDIVRIGLSPKRLEGLIEGDYYSFEDVPEDFDLTKYQRNHVNVEQNKNSIINHIEIRKMLDKLIYPLYFLDYETFPTAVPIYDGCCPYQQVPFQYSLHILKKPDGELEHYEFIHTAPESHPMKALADSLTKLMGDKGSIIVWNKKFEGKCHEDLADLLRENAEIFHSYNHRIFDLMDIFSQHHYLRHEFKGSFSIKAVLPVLVPELTYKDLNVRDGAMAMKGWKTMMFEMEKQEEKDKMRNDLLRYCELDTLAMVRIFEVLQQTI
jgi:CRISPR/Cas system-associated exonuclease Cas4 (RecB family)